MLGLLPRPLAAQDPSAPAPDPEQGDVVAAPSLVKVLLIQPENAPVRPGLEPSLRIQLRGTAELEVETVAWPAELPARVADATRRAQARGVEWVVWADPPLVDPEDPSANEVSVVYLVGKRQDRALIEVVRVPGGEGPDVDRSLALKVHELIGVRDGAAYALGNAPLPQPEPPPVETPAPVSERGRTVALFFEVGPQLASEGNAGAVLDLVLAAGPGLRGERFALDVPIEVQVGLGRSVEDARGEVSWNETSVGLALRGALRLSGALRAGAFAGVVIGFANAEGVSPAGVRGEATETLPALNFGLEGELVLLGPLSARAAFGLTQRIKRQRFAIDGQDVADLGRLLPSARVSLLYRAW
jgi:hypothetical protein